LYQQQQLRVYFYHSDSSHHARKVEVAVSGKQRRTLHSAAQLLLPANWCKTTILRDETLYRRLGSDGIRGSEAEAKYLFSAQQTSRILWKSTSTTHFSGCGRVMTECLQKRETFTPKLWTSFHSSNAASRGVIRCTGFSVVSVPFRANCRKDSWIRWKNRIRLRWLYWRDSLCC
jgi:hypothetical protein